MSLRDLDAEMAVLGAALDDARIIPRLRLEPSHFSEPLHALIWEEMAQRYRRGQIPDLLTMREWALANISAELGGPKYLAKLGASRTVLSYQLAAYAEVLRSLAHRRALTEASKEAQAAAAAADADPEAIQAALERKLQDIAASAEDGEAWKRKGDAIAYAVERAELGEAKGISTGITRLDEMLGGLKPALYLLGAASSMGKSTLLAAISRNVAAQGYGVGEFMLEMDEMEDGLRSAAALAFNPDPKVSSPHYLTAQRGALTPSQWEAMRGASRGAAHLPIYTDWRPGRSVSQMEAAARRLFTRLRRDRVEPGLIVIDHEGLIAAEPGQRFASQLERTNARAEALMALPKRLGVPVLVAGQLTNAGKRADGEERLPTMEDWKYGGALCEAAQAVMLVHRKAYYAERKPAHLRSEEDWAAVKSRETTIILDKVRGGRRGQVTILMDMPSAAVWEAAA